MENYEWVRKYRQKLHKSFRNYLLKNRNITRKSKKTGKVRIIIKLNRKLNLPLIRRIKKNLGIRNMAAMKRLGIIQALGANVTIAGVRKLCMEGCVRRMYMDYKVKTCLNVATPAVGSALARRSGRTGRGVAIAIVDTGIARHPDLTRPRNRIIAFKDFVNRRNAPYDDNGHGTHVAGCAAGNGFSSRGKYRGTAPAANLVGVKVMDRFGGGNVSRVIRGIDWVVRNRRRYGVRIMNLSLGADEFLKCSDDVLCEAATKASRAGLVVVAAAGNGGPLANTITSPGISPAVITVGAANDRGTVRQSDDRVARFSARGARRSGKPDVVAPGVNIISLKPPRGYSALSGTSMAAPIVAGTVAQILQKNPNLRPSQIKRLLKRHAFNLRARRNAQGAGEVNVRFLANNATAGRPRRATGDKTWKRSR